MFPCTFVEMFEMEQGTCNYETINLVMHYNVLVQAAFEIYITHFVVACSPEMEIVEKMGLVADGYC